jgi:cysteine desulfurase family protein
LDIIYLDNAATSWPKPEAVYQAVDRFNRQLGASPGRGIHSRTLEAGKLLLAARQDLARLFNVADCARIVYTANATESINMALKGILRPGDHVVISSMEHNAVARPLHALEHSGIGLTVVPCAPDGSLDPQDMERAIRDNTRLLCLLHASNLTGTIMPVAEVGAIARRRRVLFLVDAAQTAGILPIDVEEQQIDLLAFTGHKGLFGPQGTGGLYIRPGVDVRPLKEGGTGSQSEQVDQPDFMPDRYESGTPNTPGIAGLGAGVRFVMETGLEEIRRHEQRLAEMLIDGLREIRGATVYGPADCSRRLAVVSINIEGLDCGEVSFALDQEGIITRSGLHCAPLAHRTIGTVRPPGGRQGGHQQNGGQSAGWPGACRISPGFFNTTREIERAIRAVHAIARSAG